MSRSPWQLEKSIPDPILGPQAPNLNPIPVESVTRYYFCLPFSPHCSVSAHSEIRIAALQFRYSVAP